MMLQLAKVKESIEVWPSRLLWYTFMAAFFSFFFELLVVKIIKNAGYIPSKNPPALAKHLIWHLIACLRLKGQKSKNRLALLWRKNDWGSKSFVNYIQSDFFYISWKISDKLELKNVDFFL